MSEQNMPSKKILKNAFDGKEITDSLDRRIKLKKPDILDRFDLMSALGADANNQACINYALPLLHVLTIDGVLVERCLNKNDFRANLKLLKDEGLEALMNYIGSLDEDLSEKEEIEQAKK
jgi:hypothetical protein